MLALHTGAELTNKKQKKKGKDVRDTKALRSKTPTGPDGAEAKMGDVRAPLADGPSTEAAAEQLEDPVPADPNQPTTEPSPDTAAHCTLAAGVAAAKDADALLSSEQAAKKKKKQQSVDMAKFQTQGYMSSNSTGDKCPLDCDKLVFPVPLGKQWACVVVDMKERSITYGCSFEVPVR